MRRPLFIIATIVAALAAAPVAGASSRVPVTGSIGAATFTAQLPPSNLRGSNEKGRVGKTVVVGRSTVAIEVAKLTEYEGLDLFDLDHRTGVAHAKYIAAAHPGWRITTAESGRRIEVSSGKKVLRYLVFTAEAAQPEVFHIRLVKDGGDGQKVMRSLDQAGTRFWLGTQDPRTIVSDPDGTALAQLVNVAVSAAQQLTVTADDVRVELVHNDGYAAEFTAKGLVYWKNATAEWLYLDTESCWIGGDTTDSSSLWSGPFVGEAYALHINAPVPNGANIDLSYTGWDYNSPRADAVVLTIDPATHLPISLSEGATTETLDWTTPIVEQPAPTGPVCS